MTDCDENIIDKTYNEYINLENKLFLKDINNLIDNIIIILEDANKKSNDNNINIYLNSIKKLTNSICYSAPEFLYTKEKDLYNIIIAFHNEYVESNVDLTNAIKELWNKYKSEFKSIDL